MIVMKQLIIIGAGGMGRTLYDLARESVGYGIDFEIRGFVDDNLQALDGFANYPSVVGKISDYVPQMNEIFVCSLGGVAKRKCVEQILAHGGEFVTLVHNTARIGTNVQLGKGNVVGAYVTIGPDVVIGDYNLIQSYTIIGHDTHIGDWNRIDTRVMTVGGVVIGDEVKVHTSAVLNHNVVVEQGATVGACSFVIRKVKAGTTVFGNPAKKIGI